MALISCKECKKEVSQKAETCPHCGIKSPGLKEPTKGETLGGCLVLIVICAFVLYMCTGSSDEADTKKLSDAECLADLACSAEKHMILAATACRPWIEKDAKFGIEWTNSFLEPIFNRYSWNYFNIDKTEKLHDIVYMGDSLRFETENGEWIAMKYECMYDPVGKKLYNYTTRPGRLENIR